MGFFHPCPEIGNDLCWKQNVTDNNGSCAECRAQSCTLLSDDHLCGGSLPAQCPVTAEEARHGAIPSLLWIAWKGGVHGLLLFPPSNSGAMLGRSSASVRSFVRSLRLPLTALHQLCSPAPWMPGGYSCTSPVTITRLSSVPTAVRGDIMIHRGWLALLKAGMLLTYTPGRRSQPVLRPAYRQERAAPVHFFPEQRDELPKW